MGTSPSHCRYMSKIHTNLLLNIFDFFGPPWTCLHQAYTRGSLAEHAWEMCPVTQSVKSQNGIPLRLQAGKVRHSSALLSASKALGRLDTSRYGWILIWHQVTYHNGWDDLIVMQHMNFFQTPRSQKGSGPAHQNIITRILDALVQILCNKRLENRLEQRVGPRISIRNSIQFILLNTCFGVSS